MYVNNQMMICSCSLVCIILVLAVPLLLMLNLFILKIEILMYNAIINLGLSL